MDDRTLWVEPSGSVQDLDQALAASAHFDEAFQLQLSCDKCFVVAKAHSRSTRELASKWGFLLSDSLDLLGVSFSFEGDGAIPKFSLRKAVLRLRLLRWTQATTRSRIMLVRSLVMPCLAWAAGFARPTTDDINAVRNEVRFLFSAGFGGDVATVAFYELLGWGLEPSFALDLGLCKLCWRWVSKPPPWQEELPITFLPGQWHTGLPEVVAFLAKTGWWFNSDATALCRRDAEGALRQVDLESFRAIQGWLEDFYRSRYLLRCQRLVRKLHRGDDDDLAVGLNLEAPPIGFRVQFQGHRAALHAAVLIRTELPFCRGALLGSLTLPLLLNSKRIVASVFAVKPCRVVPTFCGPALVPRTSGLTWNRRSIAVRSDSSPGTFVRNLWLRQGLTIRAFATTSVRPFALHYRVNPASLWRLTALPRMM